MSESHFPFPRLYDTEDAFQLMWDFLQWNIVLFVRTTDQPNSREMLNFVGGFFKMCPILQIKIVAMKSYVLLWDYASVQCWHFILVRQWLELFHLILQQSEFANL